MAPEAPDAPSFDFKAKLWPYEGEGSWHFVTLPKSLSELIRSHFSPVRRGFGSVRVKVTVGGSQWKTSLFPSKGLGAYVLPIKASVRKSEGLKAGKSVSLSLEPEI
jgi:hypothetical protein